MQLPAGRVDDKLHPLRIPWTGKLIKAVDPALIGHNYQSLINLRDTGVNKRAIAGMTKITATGIATPNNTVRRLYHFKKSFPSSESHVLAIGISDTGTYRVWDNQGVIPAAAEFEATSIGGGTSTTADYGYMSDAPGECIAYCNRAASRLWGGNRSTIQKFFVQDTSNNYWDFTDEVTKGSDDLFSTQAYLKGGKVYIQTTRAIDLIAWTVETANTAATGTPRIYYWNNSQSLVAGTAANTGETITSSAHGLRNDNIVVFSTVVSGITANIRYYVINATTDTFQISLTKSPGSAVLIGADGAVTFYSIGWKSVGTVTDNTVTTTKSLAKSGTMTFASTVGAAGVTMINNAVGIWHLVEWDTPPDVTTMVSAVTVRTPLQTIIDIWDGKIAKPVQVFLYDASGTAHWAEVTANTASIDAVWTVVGSAATYSPGTVMDISSMTSADIIYAGFIEPQMGIGWVMAPEARGKTFSNTATSVMTIYRWDGDSWQICAVQDFSETSGKTLSVSGISMFSPVPVGTERKVVVNNSTELFYYKIVVSSTLSSSVMIDQIYGVPAPRDITSHMFPFMGQNRLFLLDEYYGDRNSFWASAPGSAAIWNGDMSIKDTVGDGDHLTCGCELYTRYQSNIYSIILLFKETQVWALIGTDKWTKYKITDYDGCPAPLTLTTASLPLGVMPELSRSIAIWQGAHGIYVSDGGPPHPIHQDISQYFDKNHTDYITETYITSSFGWLDKDNLEYHWCCQSGTGGTRKEHVWQLTNGQWYEVVRGSYSLTCAAPITSASGQSYVYGVREAAAAAYLLRLEYGKTFDGTDIVCTAWFGDMLLAEQPFYKCSLKHLNLMTIAKTVTTNNIVCTVYVDGNSDVTYNLDPTETGYRIADIWQPIKSKVGRYHSVKFVMTTNDEDLCFEPIDLALYFHVDERIAV